MTNQTPLPDPGTPGVFDLAVLHDVIHSSQPILLGVGIVQGMEVRFETFGIEKPAFAHATLVVANNQRIPVPMITIVQTADDMIAIAPFEVQGFLLAALIDVSKMYVLRRSEPNAEIWGPFASADVARDFLIDYYKRTRQKRIDS